MTASGLLQDIDSYAESSFLNVREHLMLNGSPHDSEFPAGTVQATLTQEQRQAAMASLAESLESQSYLVRDTFSDLPRRFRIRSWF